MGLGHPRVTLGVLDETAVNLLLHLPRHARDERMRGNLRALEHDGTGGNEGARAHVRARQHRGLHANEAVILDRRAVDERLVADGDVVAERARRVRVDVEHRVVLNVGVIPHGDGVDIAAQHRPVEHRRVRTDGDVADDGGVGGDKCGLVDARGLPTEGHDHLKGTSPIVLRSFRVLSFSTFAARASIALTAHMTWASLEEE